MTLSAAQSRPERDTWATQGSVIANGKGMTMKKTVQALMMGGALLGVTLMDAAASEAIASGTTGFESGETIAVARVEAGRMIPVPHLERYRWQDATKRSEESYELLSPAAYLRMVPELDFRGRDTDNKLDEMRLAANDEGYRYLLVYGVGEDARPGGFARRSLSATGLDPQGVAAAHDGDGAKAMLVEVGTGRVLGAVTAGVGDAYLTELTDRVTEMVERL